MQQVRLKQLTKAKKSIEAFLGYDHRPVIQDGCWYDEQNLSADQYPLLTVRRNRANAGGFFQPQPDVPELMPVPKVVAFTGKDDLVILDDQGVVWSNGHRLPIIGGQIEIAVTAAGKIPTISDEDTLLSVLRIEAPAGKNWTENGWVDTVVPGSYRFEYNVHSGEWVSDNDNSYSAADLGLTMPGDYSPHGGDVLRVLYKNTTGISSDEVSMISMGAWVAIWPWKIYVNAVKLAAGDSLMYGTDYGGMENHFSLVADDQPNDDPNDYPQVKLTLCDTEGRAYQNVVVGTEEPESTTSTWVEVTENSIHIRVYSSATMSWTVVPTTYVRIAADGICDGFKAGDGVRIRFYIPPWDMPSDHDYYLNQFMNSSHRIVKTGTDDQDGDYIVVIGIFEPELQAVQELWMTGVNDWTYEAGSETLLINEFGSATPNWKYLYVDREVPLLDYVVEAGNRLWGCYYGEKDGEILNEIYASALGDFKNWNVFQGLSTDSYVASRGADGPYTGAAVLDGHPLFFRELSVEKVFPSSSGAHQIQTQTLEGVQKGSGRSTVVIDDRLYYKGTGGVYVYTGTLPTMISPQFGEVKYGSACAGRHGKKYYISMKRSDGVWVLACYDTLSGIWHMEDAPSQSDPPVELVTWHSSLYFEQDGEICVVDGGSDSRGISWYAESGVLGLDVRERKYISRINLRYRRELGSAVRVYIQYDESGSWQLKESLVGTRLYSGTISIWPRRCDTFRIRLEGVGGFTLYSINWERERGSDV